MWTATAAIYTTYGNRSAANATIAMIFVYFGFYDIAVSAPNSEMMISCDTDRYNHPVVFTTSGCLQ